MSVQLIWIVVPMLECFPRGKMALMWGGPKKRKEKKKREEKEEGTLSEM